MLNGMSRWTALFLLTFFLSTASNSVVYSPNGKGEVIERLNTSSREKARSVLDDVYRNTGFHDRESLSYVLIDLWNGKSDLHHAVANGVYTDPVVKLKLARVCMKMQLDIVDQCAAYVFDSAYSVRWNIRANSADALVDVGGEKSVELLSAITETPNALVAIRAVRALVVLSQQGKTQDFALQTLHALYSGDSIGSEIVKKEIETQLELLERRSRTEQNSFTQEMPQFVDGDVIALRKLASKGDAESQYMLGNFYLLGLSSLPIDHELSVKWFKLSAEQGYSSAVAALANMYLTGRGVKRDRAKAIELFEKSAALGDEYSRQYLNRFIENQ